MTTASTLSKPTDTREAKPPTRVWTLQQIISWLDRLPVPQGIDFEPQPGILVIRLTTADDFQEWTTHLAGRVVSEPHPTHGASGDYLQAFSAADWAGWEVQLTLCAKLPDPPASAVDVEPVPLPAVLGCPRCPHIEYASEADPDAGLSQMHDHILRNHADGRPEATLKLLAKVTAEPYVEKAHEHGWYHREGLGYMPNDEHCDTCCSAALDRTPAEPVTDAAAISSAIDEKAAEAAGEGGE